MSLFATILVWLLVGLGIAQALLVMRFVTSLLRFKRSLIEDAAAPKAAVILCLRGGDPFLRDCITGLLGQDYPQFEVHVVVDHPSDPACSILSSILQEHATDRVTTHYLDPSIATCSLKCSSVVQAVRTLDDNCQFIAQLDADTVPHHTWLRELATALADQRVGAATGNRWYMPQNISMGSLVRYVWNAAAVVQMHSYNIAWGGTLAVKTKVLRETELLEKWSNAFCEDTMLYAFLRKHNLRLAFVPSLMMVNRESCDLRGYYSWVRRQMLTAKLYHPAWFAVIAHGVATTIVPLLALAVVPVAWMTGETNSAWWLLMTLAAYQLAMTLVLSPMEFAVRRIAAARGEPTRWMMPSGVIMYLLAVPLTQLIYAAALRSTCFLRSVDWRGIHYEIGGPWAIRRQEYHPYQGENGEQTASL